VHLPDVGGGGGGSVVVSRCRRRYKERRAIIARPSLSVGRRDVREQQNARTHTRTPPPDTPATYAPAGECIDRAGAGSPGDWARWTTNASAHGPPAQRAASVPSRRGRCARRRTAGRAIPPLATRRGEAPTIGARNPFRRVERRTRKRVPGGGAPGRAVSNRTRRPRPYDVVRRMVGDGRRARTSRRDITAPSPSSITRGEQPSGDRYRNNATWTGRVYSGVCPKSYRTKWLNVVNGNSAGARSAEAYNFVFDLNIEQIFCWKLVVRLRSTTERRIVFTTRRKRFEDGRESLCATKMWLCSTVRIAVLGPVFLAVSSYNELLLKTF